MAVLFVCIAASLAILKEAPLPWALAGLVCAAGAARLSWRAGAGSRARPVWFNVAFALLALALAELGLAGLRVHRASLDELVYEDEYTAPHATLGVAPQPSRRSRSQRSREGRIIYDVEYSIDEHGWRVTPPADPDARAVVFFGCSFTFGEGLDDEEAFPYRVGASSAGRLRVFNFSFHAYGPHQFLAALEDGLFEDLLPRGPLTLVHLAIPDHVRRVAGLTAYGQSGPRYTLTPSGALVRRGRLSAPLRKEDVVTRQLRKSEILRAWGRGRVETRSEDHERYEAVLTRVRDLLLARNPGSELHLIAWTGQPAFLDLLERVAGPDGVHPLAEVIPDYEHGRFVIDESYDPHPNRLATERLARYVLEEILEIPPTP